MNGKNLKLEYLPVYSRVKVDTGVLVRNRSVVEFNFLFVEEGKAQCMTDEGVEFTLSSDLTVEFISTMKDYDLKHKV